MTDKIAPNFKETKEQRTFRQSYMKAINKAYKYDESIGIMDIGEDKKISLQDIYIPLKFTGTDYNDDSSIGGHELKNILDLFREKRHVVISGKPGSGKTTLSRSLINTLSSDNLTKMSETFGRRLPLYFKLRDYKIDEIKNYADFFNQYIKSISNILKMNITKDDIEFYLNRGWCFLIFDGVDEVGRKGNRKKIRDFILKNFTRYNKDNYVLVTSRPAGLEESYFHAYTLEESNYIKDKEILNNNLLQNNNVPKEDIPEEDIPEEDGTPTLLNLYYVAPFDKKQIFDYSIKWFNLREEVPLVVEEKANEFISSIETIKNLSTLRRRPVFLSMMIHIHTTKGKLPYSRAKAYQYMVEAYIEHIDIARRLSKIHSKQWSFEDKERILEELAYKLHSSNIQDSNDIEKDSNAQIILNKKELELTIKEIIEENSEKWQEIEEGDEKELLDFYLSRTGLLHEPEENKIQFSHLSFQEYLTAHRIYRKVIENPFIIQETIKIEIIEKLNDENQAKWNEVILLFFSLYKDATQHILETFNKENMHNIFFKKLILNLIKSIEYGIKESDVQTWVNDIINFIVTYDQDDIELNRKQDLKNFELVVDLFNNHRLDIQQLIVYTKSKFITLLNLGDMKQIEKILYLISYNERVSKEFSELIENNIQSLVNEDNLILALDILSEDNHAISPYVFEQLSLENTLNYYETISPSSKYMFLEKESINWKQLIMHYDWLINNLYGFIQLYRIYKKNSVPSSIKSFNKLKQYKRHKINDMWNNYWYSNIWKEHRNGLTKQLKHDALYGRYEFYLNDNPFSFMRFDNKDLRNSLGEIEDTLRTNTNKSEVLSSIFVLSSTTNIIKEKHGLNFSIPWKTFQEFQEFSKLFKNKNNFHQYLEKETKQQIDKKQFIKEIDICMEENYSIKKIIDKILKNEEYYIIYSHKEVVNIITQITK